MLNILTIVTSRSIILFLSILLFKIMVEKEKKRKFCHKMFWLWYILKSQEMEWFIHYFIILMALGLHWPLWGKQTPVFFAWQASIVRASRKESHQKPPTPFWLLIPPNSVNKLNKYFFSYHYILYQWLFIIVKTLFGLNYLKKQNSVWFQQIK